MPPTEIRILALDVGTVRVGTAISDPLGITAQPGPVLERQPEKVFFESLKDLIEEWGIGEAVIGFPRGLKGGQKGASCQDVKELLPLLRERWPKILWKTFDERFTTTMAIKVLSSAPKKKREQKGLRDRIAAQLILESYLQAR